MAMLYLQRRWGRCSKTVDFGNTLAVAAGLIVALVRSLLEHFLLLIYFFIGTETVEHLLPYTRPRGIVATATIPTIGIEVGKTLVISYPLG